MDARGDELDEEGVEAAAGALASIVLSWFDSPGSGAGTK